MARVLDDTIFAVASPPGAGARGVIRISGGEAISAVRAVLGLDLPQRRAVREGSVQVLDQPVECLVLVMPGPASYTGEDVVELHLPGSPLLLEIVQARLRGHMRDATPGEFTRRAFENGKLDLAEAEAVHALIAAAGENERRHAMFVLGGGLADAIDRLRADVLDARALLEAGLDFTAGETGEVPRDAWLGSLRAVLRRVEELRAGLPSALPGGDLLLVGAANAGKSSLCNALVGDAQLLVSDVAGTTRDVLAVELAPGVRLLDAPGDLDAPLPLDRSALRLRDSLAAGAGAAIAVLDATRPAPVRTALPVVAVVVTKVDLAEAPEIAESPDAPRFAVSSVTGAGIPELRAFLCSRGASAAPSGTRRRVADLLERAARSLGQAIAAGDAAAPEELVSEELAGCLAQLDAVHGRSTSEAVLDRIFAGFCLGK